MQVRSSMFRLPSWRWYCWKSWLLTALFLGFGALYSAQTASQKLRRSQWLNRVRQRRQIWSNEWSPWASWSACSSTCGGGASFRTRQCLRYLNTEDCPGDQRQYKVCNVLDCPPGSVDFRKMQCSLYNNKPIQGNLMNHQWLPFYGAPNQCDLNCLAKGKNFYYMFGRVLDGTKCRPDSSDMCINGQCLKVGCDSILGSKARADVCGVCGGRNDSCILVRRVYRSAFPSSGYFGYNNVTVIPAGATNIKVTDNSRNYLALINGKNHYVINGNWVIDWPGEYDVAGTKVLYKRSASNHETIEATGPTAEDLHVMVLLQEENSGIEYEFWLPHERYSHYQGGHSPLRQPEIAVIDADHPLSYLPWTQTTTATSPVRNPVVQPGWVHPALQPPVHSAQVDHFQNILPRDPIQSTRHEPSYCRKCKKSKGKSQRIKQYCQKDFVFRGRILRKAIVGSETRYDVQIRQTYKNKYPIVHREYIWVPNTCDCPYILEKREYIMMARRHVNFEQTLNRILLEHNSFVRLWQPKEDLMLRDMDKYCHRYS
ncbi:ADAMTS-like protein 5 isoform X2 [Stegostoma tigrinum]|uniref:ADAMTS-like protein 5 isoform X2 n=1 Tax=Stegostoma tigrinum TaxID=3053191 RepID=UPI00287034F1|nr:ADAMTS-like protein 5 isoform X2 [Stegostoma tigrinum]